MESSETVLEFKSLIMCLMLNAWTNATSWMSVWLLYGIKITRIYVDNGEEKEKERVLFITVVGVYRLKLMILR